MIGIIIGMLLTQDLKSPSSRHYGHIIAVKSSRMFLFADLQDQKAHYVALDQGEYFILRKSKYKSLNSIKKTGAIISFLTKENKYSELIAYRFAIGESVSNARFKGLTCIRWNLLKRQ